MYIIISGANGLIGSYLIESLLKEGKKIIGIDIHSNNNLQHRNFKFYNLDISCENSVSNFYQDLGKENIEISALINAHQYKPKGFLKDEVNDDLNLWKSVIEANLNGVYFMCNGLKKYKGPKSKTISIINFGSTYGRVSSNPNLYSNNSMGNPACYSASKGGVHMLTKYLAANWIKDGIRTNTIVPHGVINNHEDNFINKFSQMTPIGRMMRVEEILPSIELLLDHRNTYMNGSEIVIDGGWSIW